MLSPGVHISSTVHRNYGEYQLGSNIGDVSWIKTVSTMGLITVCKITTDTVGVSLMHANL